MSIKKINTKKNQTPVEKKPVNKLSTWLKILWISNIVAFVAVVIVNYLAVSLPIGWMTTGALSDLYPNLFVPTGLTFSIWGVIYLWLFLFVIWQIVDLFKKKSSKITKKIWIRFLLSCMINIGWIFAWHYKLVFLSVIIMLFFLITMIIIGHKIELWKKLWNLWDKYLVQVPFSLYLWWISVATIANISAWLVNIGRAGLWMSDIFRTILVIIVAALLALRQMYKYSNIVFALVVIWAFLWIILKSLSADIIYTNIIWVLWISMVIISAWIGRNFQKWRKN